MWQPIKTLAKPPLALLHRALHRRLGPKYDLDSLLRAYVDAARHFSTDEAAGTVRTGALEFVRSCRAGTQPWMYGHTAGGSAPNLYSSVHACLILSLTGAVRALPEGDRLGWLRFFDEHQLESDGLFYDPVFSGMRFAASDWWGARHLAANMIAAYAALGGRPRHRFACLEAQVKPGGIEAWLEGGDWRAQADFDNQVMNIGNLLQYSRDYFDDAAAGRAVRELIVQIEKRIDRGTGLVWPVDIAADARSQPANLSRAVQLSYHLFAVAHYDRWRHPQPEALQRSVRATANALGGFGPGLNASACEDIDSIDLLCRYSPAGGGEDARRLASAAVWVLANRNPDGGFVFQRGVPFEYGHGVLATKADESSLFATWFRLLSLAYLQGRVNLELGLGIRDCPGYEYDRQTL